MRAKRSDLSQQVITMHQQTDVHESITKQDRNNINDPQKKRRLGTVCKNNLLEGLNRLNGAPAPPPPPLVQMWIKTLILCETSKPPLDIFSYILIYMMRTWLQFTLNMEKSMKQNMSKFHFHKMKLTCSIDRLYKGTIAFHFTQTLKSGLIA